MPRETLRFDEDYDFETPREQAAKDRKEKLEKGIFEWDERKNRSNLRKHGFDLADAVPMFNGPMLALPDDREEYEENRWIGIGITHGRIAVVAFAECGEECIRIISLRKANQRERRLFEETIANAMEED
jgi:uncharacterized protein